MTFHIITYSLFLILLNISAFAAPSISSTALILYRDSNFHKEDFDPANPDQTPNGLNIQELEIKLNAEVDPHTELNLVQIGRAHV